MVHSMHIRCYQKQPDQPIDTDRDMEVAMVEHGSGIQGHFKNENGQRRRAKSSYPRDLQRH